jgi:hypothetical protein
MAEPSTDREGKSQVGRMAGIVAQGPTTLSLSQHCQHVINTLWKKSSSPSDTHNSSSVSEGVPPCQTNSRPLPAGRGLSGAVRPSGGYSETPVSGATGSARAPFSGAGTALAEPVAPIPKHPQPLGSRHQFSQPPPHGWCFSAAFLPREPELILNSGESPEFRWKYRYGFRGTMSPNGDRERTKSDVARPSLDC